MEAEPTQAENEELPRPEPERQRWTMPQEMRDRLLRFLDEMVHNPKKRASLRLSAAKLIARINQQNLSDIQHIDNLEAQAGLFRLRAQRAEAGKPNDSLAVIVPPVQQMPLPQYLEDIVAEREKITKAGN